MNFGFWGIIWTIIIGLVLGVLGRLILPGKQNIPIWLTILAGVVASIVGYLIAGALGVATTSGVDWAELIIKIVLAVAAVYAATALYGRRGVKSSPTRRRVGPGPGRPGALAAFRDLFYRTNRTVNG
jgi:uncharacterized membrane protein YeaQ/YmgE (transglycosylase-associated protein family)